MAVARSGERQPAAAVAQTERLAIRRMTADDAPFLLRLLTEPGFIRNIGDRGVRSLAGAREYVEKTALWSYTQFGYGPWLVETRDPCEPIGMCGLFRKVWLPAPDLGYALVQAAEGRGYATEAATAVMEHARSVLFIPELLAVVQPANAPSIRVLQKLAFRLHSMTENPTTAESLALYHAVLDPAQGARTTLPQPSSRSARRR